LCRQTADGRCPMIARYRWGSAVPAVGKTTLGPTARPARQGPGRPATTPTGSGNYLTLRRFISNKRETCQSSSLHESSRSYRLNLVLHFKVVTLDGCLRHAEYQRVGFKYSPNLLNSFHLVDGCWPRGGATMFGSPSLPQSARSRGLRSAKGAAAPRQHRTAVAPPFPASTQGSCETPKAGFSRRNLGLRDVRKRSNRWS
jgi:hypothetical protein